MAEFYRGRKVSQYRKQSQTGVDSTLTINGPLVAEVGPGSPDDRVRYMKNFRGMVTVFANDSTPYNNYGTGVIGLIRYPAQETLGVSDMKIENSSFLHPVPYAFGGAPLTLLYDFKGITLGQSEKLYFVVIPGLTFGNTAACWELVWAQKDIVTP